MVMAGCESAMLRMRSGDAISHHTPSPIHRFEIVISALRSDGPSRPSTLFSRAAFM